MKTKGPFQTLRTEKNNTFFIPNRCYLCYACQSILTMQFIHATEGFSRLSIYLIGAGLTCTLCLFYH